MGYVALFIEVKANPNDDFFVDPPDGEDRKAWPFVFGMEERTPKRRRDFGQAVDYAVEACKRQHRHCIYSISMSGSYVRFVRWDRAGAVVSERFDIRILPKLLCEFLWCFAQLSDADRGYDFTVEPVDDEKEEQVFKNAIRSHVTSQLGPSAAGRYLDKLVEEHFEAGAVTSVYLSSYPLNDYTCGVRLLVCCPIAVPLSLTGRGTRVYWAVLVQESGTPKVVLLKDTWRHGDPLVKKEGDVIHDLNTKGVKNVPQIIHNEDVPLVVVEDTEDPERPNILYDEGPCEC